MNTIVEDIMSENINQHPLVSEHFVDAYECRKIISRIACEPPEVNDNFQGAQVFDGNKWPHVLFPADDNPIGNDMDLVKQVNQGLKIENLPRTDEGVVRLLAIWFYS